MQNIKIFRNWRFFILHFSCNLIIINTPLTIYKLLQTERFLYIYTQKKVYYADRNK